MKYDLHIHSKYSSDGILDREKIAKIAMNRGLNGITITDHNMIKSELKAKNYENEIGNAGIITETEDVREAIKTIGRFLKNR